MVNRIRIAAACLTAATTLHGLACSSSESGPPSQPSPVSDAGSDADANVPITWGECKSGYVSECATIPMPLDHAKPDGETIDFYVARYPAANQPAKRQVWLLPGGPGQAGWVFGKSAAAFAAMMPDTDFYMPDHRGTGYSHRLTCPAQDQEGTYGGLNLDPTQVKPCLDALKKKGDFEKLPYFTSTQAAADTLAAIAKTRGPSQKVYVWGISYGTHLAHRMVQMQPNNVIDGAIFDGFLTPNQWAASDYDKGAEEAGSAFAAECDADASCSQHFLGTTGTPGASMAKIRSVLDKLKTTKCLPFDRTQARLFISVLLDPWPLRALIFPMLHRLERCTVEDRNALDFMVRAYSALGSSGPPFVNSGVLQHNITLWELWQRPGSTLPTKAEFQAKADSQVFLQGESLAVNMYDLHALWPAPPDDYSKWPTPVTTTTKMVWLAGSFDLHAAPSQAAMLPALYPQATYVMVKGASHTPSNQAPLASDVKKNCGQEIINAFVNGDGAIDTSCTGNLLKPWLEAQTAAFAKKYWNTDDDWGDGTPKP